VVFLGALAKGLSLHYFDFIQKITENTQNQSDYFLWFSSNIYHDCQSLWQK